jgi:hypothetical protein
MESATAAAGLASIEELCTVEAKTKRLLATHTRGMAMWLAETGAGQCSDSVVCYLSGGVAVVVL